jgi:hypothetical protein
MQKLSGVSVVCVAICIACGMSYGEDVTPTLVPTGFVSLREGQVVKGEKEFGFTQARADHVWIQEMVVGLNVLAKFNNLPLTGNLGM